MLGRPCRAARVRKMAARTLLPKRSAVLARRLNLRKRRSDGLAGACASSGSGDSEWFQVAVSTGPAGKGALGNRVDLSSDWASTSIAKTSSTASKSAIDGKYELRRVGEK